MNSLKCAVVWLSALVLATETLSAQEYCKALSPETVNRLERFVHDKFGFPPTTFIRMAGSELLGVDCYRRVEFRSEGNLARMRTKLYLTPDERFLSRELMDSTVDLAVQSATEQRRLKERLTSGRFPTIGNLGESHIITVFSDFQCSFCKQQAAILREVSSSAEINVRIIFRHLPLPVHAWAKSAAEMSACVFEQDNDAFWCLHNFLFARQESLTPENLPRAVEDIVEKEPRVNVGEYKRCLAVGRGADNVGNDIAFARQHDIQSTPTVFFDGIRNVGIITLDGIRALARESR